MAAVDEAMALLRESDHAGGVRVFCDRDGLVFGLALARRALALSLAALWQSEITLRFDGSESSLSPDEWPVSGDFLLARADEGGELVDPYIGIVT